VALTDNHGTTKASYTYDAFGNYVQPEPPPPPSSVTNPFRYTGRELDSETGLYYYRARYYDSTIGRFLSEDPVRYAGGRNFFVYVGSSPTNLFDPLGLKPCSLPIVPKEPGQRKAPTLTVCPSQSLIDCLIQTESGGNEKAVSNKGAKGKWQVMPSAVAELQMQSLIGDKYDLDQVGLLYLKLLLTSCDTTENAVAAYNAGPGAVNKAGGLPDIKETKDYVKKIGDCLKGKGVAKGLQDPAATCPCTN
jgi:RHS repeat-associated protein